MKIKQSGHPKVAAIQLSGVHFDAENGIFNLHLDSPEDAHILQEYLAKTDLAIDDGPSHDRSVATTPRANSMHKRKQDQRKPSPKKNKGNNQAPKSKPSYTPSQPVVIWGNAMSGNPHSYNPRHTIFASSPTNAPTRPAAYGYDSPQNRPRPQGLDAHSSNIPTNPPTEPSTFANSGLPRWPEPQEPKEYSPPPFSPPQPNRPATFEYNSLPNRPEPQRRRDSAYSPPAVLPPMQMPPSGPAASRKNSMNDRKGNRMPNRPNKKGIPRSNGPRKPPAPPQAVYADKAERRRMARHRHKARKQQN